MRSSVSRISKRSGIASVVARRIASLSRLLRRPLTISSRSKWRVCAVRASITGLMPQIKFIRWSASFTSSTVASAAMPSARPSAPRWSALLALTDTASAPTPRSAAIVARMPSRCGASTGSWAITVRSRLPRRKPRALTSRDTSSTKTRLSTPCQRGSRLGKWRPMSPSPIAPSSASHTACSTQSPSEWPSRPRVCSSSTPPSRSGRPATRRWTSKPLADAQCPLRSSSCAQDTRNARLRPTRGRRAS